MQRYFRYGTLALLDLVMLAIAGCGGGGGGPPTPTVSLVKASIPQVAPGGQVTFTVDGTLLSTSMTGSLSGGSLCQPPTGSSTQLTFVCTAPLSGSSTTFTVSDGSTRVSGNTTLSIHLWMESVLHSFAGGTTDGMEPAASLIIDSTGTLYGTTYYGGVNNDGTVFKVSATGTESVLHSFAGGTSDGSEPVARLLMDSAGNLYGTTQIGGANNDGTVFKISATGTESVLYSFKGYPTDGAEPFGGLIMDSAGNLYGTTAGGGPNNAGTVFKISAAGAESVLHSFAGGTTDGAGPEGDLIMDSAGNLYGTTELGGAGNDGTVFKISAAGSESLLHSFTGGTTDGAGPVAGLIMDGAGNLYGTTPVGGANNDGTAFMISAAGSESVLYSFAGGTSDGADPRANLIIDSAGTLYGTTANGGPNGSGTVFRISAAGSETVLYYFGGELINGAGPVAGLIMDSAGNLYGTTESGGASGDGTVFKIE